MLLGCPGHASGVPRLLSSPYSWGALVMVLGGPGCVPGVSWLCSLGCPVHASEVPCPSSWGALAMFLGCSAYAPGVPRLPSQDVLSMLLGSPDHVPGVPWPRTPLAELMLAFPGSRRTGWSSTPRGMSKATAAPNAAEPTATAGGSASPSWATTPTRTATRAGGSSAASSCPATGGSRGCWAGCSTQCSGAVLHPPPASAPIWMHLDAAEVWIFTCLIAGGRASPRAAAPSPSTRRLSPSRTLRCWGRPCSSASSPR